MRERVMTPETARIENGHLVICDRAGIARWTSNPADSDASREAGRGFNINNVRLANTENLILHRYGGPVDTDDAHAYLSVAFNAIAMGRRLRGWKQATGPLIAWAQLWTPLADAAEVDALAQNVAAAPRKMTGRTVGKLVRLTQSEWEALNIKTIDPFDIPPKQVATVKADRKRKRDKAAAEAARRKGGARSMEEIQSTSRREFCERHSLSERSFYRHQQIGDLDAWLAKKGITEKWQTPVATLEKTSTLISRHPSATFSKRPKPSPRRAAQKPPRRKTDLAKSKPAPKEPPVSNVITFAPILADPARREKLARLFDVVANTFTRPEPEAAGRAG